MWNEVQWIKIPDMELRNKQILHGDLGGRFAYFRLEQELPTDARLTARITAVLRLSYQVQHRTKKGKTLRALCVRMKLPHTN